MRLPTFPYRAVYGLLPDCAAANPAVKQWTRKLEIPERCSRYFRTFPANIPPYSTQLSWGAPLLTATTLTALCSCFTRVFFTTNIPPDEQYMSADKLSPKVAVELEGPFFAAAGLLGDSARLEGLVSALWLLPDLTLVGLLCRSWGERRWPMLGAALALGLALTGMTGALPRAALPLGSIALAGLTAIVPVRTGKIVAGP